MADRKRKGNGEIRRSSEGGLTGHWRTVFIAILVILLVTIVIIVKNIVSLSVEKGNLTEQEQSLQNKKEELTAELQGVNDTDYIEEQARKLLKMIKPGEVLYILNGEDPRPETEEGEGDELPPPTPAPLPAVEETSEEPIEEAVEEPIEEPVEEVVEEEPLEETTSEEEPNPESQGDGEGTGEEVETASEEGAYEGEG